MAYSIETVTSFSSRNLEQAAELTAAGFGRANDDHNFQDTADHLVDADIVQLMHHEKQLVAFAAYRRLLW